ncbi:taurine catabolism dioxygenase TauD [Frankia sp. CcI49]|uniref:TauD/TfdA dioxygenase family protein n=1 Tax=Frankia sp. CcI49 TaxID=1745382 RepID=UPI0009779E64|nr:TauD/TfdA family dioxygenase [Frankia sp. CcI49]ONH62026.1 taurine catabolism dioxygenase TauD [Frankia sp. CcI49]
MAALVTEKLGEYVGAEVLDADADRLLHDEDLPQACLEALEEHGVLLFRELNLDYATQVAFCRRLGELLSFPKTPPLDFPEIMEINWDPANPRSDYFRGNTAWHIDGALDPGNPPKASVMSGGVVTDSGGETEFASTYAAYDSLSAQEKEEFGRLRVIHTLEAILRPAYPNPTPEQRADWAKRPAKEHPLVWRHESGRRSLVFGSTTSHIAGMDEAQGRALLDELERRATTPDRVLQHTWKQGDMVIWDNRGLVHRVRPFDPDVPRRMYRTTLAGDEPIQ